MQVAVLGPVTAARDGAPVALGAPKQRSLLAALALHAGRAVSQDALVELLWGDHAPAAAGASVQTYVAGLRPALEPGRAARSASTVLPSTTLGYALLLPRDDALDAARFASTVERVHGRLARPSGSLPLPPDDLSATEAHDLRVELDAVLATWRGTPYADLRDSDAVRAADPELRAELARMWEVHRQELERLITAADLPGAPPPPVAARILAALAHGTQVQWAVAPDGALRERLLADIDAVLTAWARRA